MTKNEIIRELSKSTPCRVKSLSVIYHNKANGVRYVFNYEWTTHSSDELLREFARVFLSLWKLRKYVECICVSYFSDETGDSIRRIYDSCNRVNSVSDFIKSIKK